MTQQVHCSQQFDGSRQANDGGWHGLKPALENADHCRMVTKTGVRPWFLRIGYCLVALFATGCLGPTAPGVLPANQRFSFREECIKFMENSAFSRSPALRMQALEAFKAVAPDEGNKLKAIPLNIENEYAGVSFAGIMAAGETGSKQHVELVRTRAESQDKNVRIAALFALHQFGDRKRTGELAQYLLSDDDETVRSNAALVLGRTGDEKMVRVLKEALRREKMELPRVQILEALAMLGDEPAIQRLMFVGRSAIPQDAAIALMMLGNAKVKEAESLFWVRFQDADFPEIRVLSIRGLAELGRRDMLKPAIEHLAFNDPKTGIEHDPPRQQIDRVRGVAALALEALAMPEGLQPLKSAFNAPGQSDYVKLAVARAAVKTIDAARGRP